MENPRWQSHLWAKNWGVCPFKATQNFKFKSYFNKRKFQGSGSEVHFVFIKKSGFSPSWNMKSSKSIYFLPVSGGSIWGSFRRSLHPSVLCWVRSLIWIPAFLVLCWVTGRERNWLQSCNSICRLWWCLWYYQYLEIKLQFAIFLPLPICFPNIGE